MHKQYRLYVTNLDDGDKEYWEIEVMTTGIAGEYYLILWWKSNKRNDKGYYHTKVEYCHYNSTPEKYMEYIFELDNIVRDTLGTTDTFNKVN